MYNVQSRHQFIPMKRCTLKWKAKFTDITKVITLFQIFNIALLVVKNMIVKVLYAPNFVAMYIAHTVGMPATEWPVALPHYYVTPLSRPIFPELFEVYGEKKKRKNTICIESKFFWGVEFFSFQISTLNISLQQKSSPQKLTARLEL